MAISNVQANGSPVSFRAAIELLIAVLAPNLGGLEFDLVRSADTIWPTPRMVLLNGA